MHRVGLSSTQIDIVLHTKEEIYIRASYLLRKESTIIWRVTRDYYSRVLVLIGGFQNDFNQFDQLRIFMSRLRLL